MWTAHPKHMALIEQCLYHGWLLHATLKVAPQLAPQPSYTVAHRRSLPGVETCFLFSSTKQYRQLGHYRVIQAREAAKAHVFI
jgi:hypothetical protein